MNFTERQKEVMSLAWRCFDTEPKVNYEKLAALAGFANAASANAFWYKIKTKLVSTPGSAGKCGITSKRNGIANKPRGLSKGSRSISKKPLKREEDASSKMLALKTEEAGAPMQSIPLAHGSLNDRSGLFTQREPIEEMDTVASVNVTAGEGIRNESSQVDAE